MTRRNWKSRFTLPGTISLERVFAEKIASGDELSVVLCDAVRKTAESNYTQGGQSACCVPMTGSLRWWRTGHPVRTKNLAPASSLS